MKIRNTVVCCLSLFKRLANKSEKKKKKEKKKNRNKNLYPAGIQSKLQWRTLCGPMFYSYSSKKQMKKKKVKSHSTLIILG